MNNLKQHLVYRVSALVLAFAFLLPLAVNFIHNIEHEHQYELCDNPNETHLHKLEKDCDYCKFKLNQNHHSIETNLELVRVVISTAPIYTSYSYQHNYQHVSFSLRAPPVLV